MKTVEIPTTWGVIALKLDTNGKAAALDFPVLHAEPGKFAFLKDSYNFLYLEKKFGPVKIPEGTAFQRAVWREMTKIPRGQTRTYGEIASAIGKPRAVRAVGTACGANPLPVFIPCHRVVAKKGLGGFGGGLPWKILLLKTEGTL